ncbi:hypothetical protein AB0903_30085 [Streptomyces sp. NPDC048389]
MCVWTQTNYGGTMGKVFGNNNDLSLFFTDFGSLG